MQDPIGFASNLIPLIIQGEKVYTYRLGEKYLSLKEGDTLPFKDFGTNETIGMIRIIEVSKSSFKDLPIDRTGHEPYFSKESQRKIFKGYYGREISDEEPVVVLKFQLVSGGDIEE